MARAASASVALATNTGPTTGSPGCTQANVQAADGRHLGTLDFAAVVEQLAS